MGVPQILQASILNTQLVTINNIQFKEELRQGLSLLKISIKQMIQGLLKTS